MKQAITNKTFKNSKLPLFYVYSENIYYKYIYTYMHKYIYLCKGVLSTNISTTALTLLLMVAF